MRATRYIPFLDLSRQSAAIREEIAEAVLGVIDGGTYVLGDRGRRFENSFAAFCGASQCVAVGSGTDALALALKASGVKPGDEVLVPALTAIATIAAIVAASARPVLVDVDPTTLTIDTTRLSDMLSRRSRAILPVHLYGRCADMDAVNAFAGEHGLTVVEDASHAHGAELRGRRAGSLGTAAAFSFYPTKNLGALGDGGAVVTDDAEIAGRVRLLRAHGMDGDRGALHRSGNSRLDEIHAAVLLVKLRHLHAWTERRRAIAEAYTRGLAKLDGLVTPADDRDGRHVFHLFVVRHPQRDQLRERLHQDGIGTATHYSLAAHEHPAYRRVRRSASLVHSERAAREVLSIPLHPALSDAEVERVIGSVVDAAKAASR